MTKEEAITELSVLYERFDIGMGWRDGNYTEALDMAIEALSAESETLSHEEAWAEIESDLISRADAVNAVHKYFVDAFNNEPHEIDEDGDDVFTDMKSVNALLRHNKMVSKALKALPSAEAVQGWIPFTRRPMTEEEQKDYPNCTFIFDCVLPDDGDEILVSNGRFVWTDTFYNDIDGCYLDGGDDIDEDMAWMPLPKPYKGGDE